MKLRKKFLSLIIATTLLSSTVAAYAGTISVDQAWDQLSSNQQSKLGEVGIDKKALNKLESVGGGLDILFSPPLNYKNNNFTISESDAKQVLYLISITSNKEFDSDKMMGTFKDVVADINKNSSTKTKQDFANLLAQYGLSEGKVNDNQSQGGAGGGGGGGVGETGGKNESNGANGSNGALAQQDIKGKLENKLDSLKQATDQGKAKDSELQKVIEILSSHAQKPLDTVSTEGVQNVWKESLEWQKSNAKGAVFAKASIPVARIAMQNNKEVTVSKELWNNASAQGRLDLVADKVVLSIDKNTYNAASKIKLNSINKEGYNQAATLSTSTKIYSPAKISFYVDVESPEEYGIYKLVDDKEILIGGIYNEAIGTVEALVNSSGTYVMKKTTPVSYKDLEGFDWAKKQINHLGQKGYVGGKAEGVYAPKDDITRAEFAVLLTRIMQLPSSNVQNNFKDMKADDWYYADVMATVEAKLFNGKSASSFDPSGKITRQEVAAVISRIMVQKGYSEPAGAKAEKGVWAPGALALVRNQSMVSSINGFNDNVVKNANRAEVAYMLYNLLHK